MLTAYLRCFTICVTFIQGVHAGLTMSYKVLFGFSIDTALQSLILGFFDHKGLIKSFFLLKIFQHWEMDFLSWKLH